MSNISPFPNPYNAQVKPLEVSEQANTTMTYHGGAIAANGRVIGRVKDWTPGKFERTVTEVREVSNTAWGVPVDNVPGIASGYTVSFTRTEVWQQELETVLGYNATWTSLCDQTRPFEAFEYLFRGATPYRVWLYKGAWFTSRNPNTWSSDGNGIIEVACEFAYVVRHKVAG